MKKDFSRRHPVLRDTLVWALPALIFGGLLRALLVNYLPYAFWGPDARSYFKFPHTLLTEGYVSFPEKRRFLYPLLLAPISALPGAPLRWLPIWQHALGLATILAFAYVVRKTLAHWRFWIIPATLFFAGQPLFVWYEHELLGETLFFDTLLWTFAGWVAWTDQEKPGRSRKLFWWFFVPLVLMLATKPAGRFFLPGIFAGFLITAAWRRLGWRQVTALAVAICLVPTVGSKKQGAWLLYVATFPLTQLGTPLRAEYKREIQHAVTQSRGQVDLYYFLEDGEPFALIRDPGEQNERPLWKALGKDEKLKSKVYFDLALEGIKAEPGLFLYLGWQRLIASANLSQFDLRRYFAGFYVEHLREFHTEAARSESSPIRLAFALPPHGPLPDYQEFARRLEPAGEDNTSARMVRAFVGLYASELFDPFRFPKGPPFERKASLVRPAPFGLWLFLGMLLSFLPRYRRTLGVWTIVSAIYLLAVFLVTVTSLRYFAPVWPVFFILALVPLDAVAEVFRSLSRRGRSP